MVPAIETMWPTNGWNYENLSSSNYTGKDYDPNCEGFGRRHIFSKTLFLYIVTIS